MINDREDWTEMEHEKADIKKRMQYILNMRPVFNKEALFSDGTEYYRIPAEPKAGDTVTIIFRTQRNNVDSVYLVSQEQNRKEKYPSGPEKTSGDQCTGACICLYFSCESKNRGNRNPEIFRKYEAGSEWGYAFQSASGDRKSTRLNSSHTQKSRMPSSA